MELSRFIAHRNLVAGLVWVLSIRDLLDNLFIVNALRVSVIAHLDIDILQITLEIGWLRLWCEIFRVNISHLVYLRMFGLTSNVGLTISILGCG